MNKIKMHFFINPSGNELAQVGFTNRKTNSLISQINPNVKLEWLKIPRKELIKMIYHGDTRPVGQANIG